MKSESFIQLISITPEQLQSLYLQGIKLEFEELKKSFQPKEPTKYLTRSEVSEMLKVDLSTVHNWTKKGKLKAYGIGGRVYYKRQEIEESLIKLS
ncbi:DNA-binding protein [Aquimarina sp. AD10]|uniref:helix-turn-helix domain-containing protein n=1 Tax=Aquimarina sp. AD10 TaxID=1714849 RepID=UPI000E477D86|nr:helix-turn-helix domain-containing protein [Aquimarina sp. AD10]AXT63095.1 DNA-binding protein [Aquimarina sp. AD10]RKM98689.1 helix-turn-helix domain-containing protein [Aquimarina sp. AD10]